MFNFEGVGLGFRRELFVDILFILFLEVDFWEVVLENWIFFGGVY